MQAFIWIRRHKMKTPDEIRREAQELENELRSGGKNFFDVLIKAANLSREAERTEADLSLKKKGRGQK